ncbi:hypothetical protein C4J81_07280 [Deltaproteobacteria bacterium Smac51]|nr:hypothetical protein C4J81_07280 [Deltaproteobacteria bacterium Smac51]
MFEWRVTAAGRNVFALGSVTKDPRNGTQGKNISPGGCLVGFLKGWKVCLAEWEPEAGDCFCPVSVTKDPRNGDGTKTIPGFRRVRAISRKFKIYMPLVPRSRKGVGGEKRNVVI